MNKTYLRLDIYGDAARARFLKRLCRSKRTNPAQRSDAQSALHFQRVETRCELLALGFLRHKPHDQLERPLRPVSQGCVSTKNMSRTHPDWDRIEEIIQYYGGLYFDGDQDMAQKFTEWRDNAIGTPS